jgi:hypothetical protein
MEEHTGFTPWMLTTPYSLKLLSSLLWEEASRNTRNCSKPWSTQKGLSFPKRFSGIQKSSTFPHGSEHTQSVWLKAVLQSEFKGITYVLNLVNSKLKKKNLTNTHTHTNTHTGTYTDKSADILFLNQWSNFFIPSTELQRSKGETTLNSRTAGCTPSLPTMRMRGFLSRMLMHTQRVDTLNECEIVGTVRIFIKSKQISSLWHYGYYTHS